MTLETLIAFLTIENNNMDNYIVIFEYRVMVTAFAILAMFLYKCSIHETRKMNKNENYLNSYETAVTKLLLNSN